MDSLTRGYARLSLVGSCIFFIRDAGQGAEGSKCLPCLSFGGAGGVKVPSLKCNRYDMIPTDIDKMQRRSNMLYKLAKYDWKRELFI